MAARIRVSVLEGPFTVLSEVGVPLPVCISMQSKGLQLDKALWTVRQSNGGFSVTFFWPTLESKSAQDLKAVVKKRRKRRRQKRKVRPQHEVVEAQHPRDSKKNQNIIYLITCSKCKKQYVGFTTQQLNIRINHHRTNIFNHVQTYVSNHFNFSDHSIRDLTVQVIDSPENGPNIYQKLKELERYWIKTLKTLRPLGLNVSSGLV